MERLVARISKAEAVVILKDHSLEPWDTTAWWPETGLRDVTSSFYGTFGNHSTYLRGAIYRWLGY